MKREENEKMVGGINKGKEDDQGMKIVIEDNKGGDRDIENIYGRKVKEKDKREATKSKQRDLEKSIMISCDEVLRWTMHQRNVGYVYLKMTQQVIEERMLAEENGSRRSNEYIMPFA